MKTTITSKILLLAICLLLQFSLQAQQEWEDITSKFGTWQVDDDLTTYSNSLTHLQIENKKNKFIHFDGKIVYKSAFLNLNLKESKPFEITFSLKNESVKPYTSPMPKNYWGVFFEFYTKDGNVVSSTFWICKNEGEYYNGYSINKNNSGWETWDGALYDETIKISCNNNHLYTSFKYLYHTSFLDYYIADWNQIAGIKSIKIMVGSYAKIAVKNFIVKRKTEYGIAKPIVDKGDEYMQREQYTNAVQEYTNAINQGYKDAYFLRGLCKLQKNDDSGIADLRKGGDEGIALLKEMGLFDYYPSNNSEQKKSQPQQKIPQNALKKDPNFKIE